MGLFFTSDTHLWWCLYRFLSVKAQGGVFSKNFTTLPMSSIAYMSAYKCYFRYRLLCCYDVLPCPVTSPLLMVWQLLRHWSWSELPVTRPTWRRDAPPRHRAQRRSCVGVNSGSSPGRGTPTVVRGHGNTACSNCSAAPSPSAICKPNLRAEIIQLELHFSIKPKRIQMYPCIWIIMIHKH